MGPRPTSLAPDGISPLQVSRLSFPRPIYLDHHATTPCDPRVVEAMAPTWSEVFGNASSSQHEFGRAAARLIDDARREVAALIACDPREVIFTSGATESINLALKGVAALAGPRAHIVTSVIEHRAVLDACAALERSGVSVSYVRVNRHGIVAPEAIEDALRPATVLVSIMAANNEIGTLQPIAEIGALVHERGILFHSDATQAIGHLRCEVDSMQVDLLSLSAHKIYGPKGVGALFVRRRRPRVRLQPILDGGGHERGFRSGTLNVSGIVGLGEAARIVLSEREDEASRIRSLRDRLLSILRREIAGVIVNGSLAERLPGNLNLTFPDAPAHNVIQRLAGVAVSSGSACSSPHTDGSSYVLRALGEPSASTLGGIRIGIGRGNTADEIDAAAERIARAVAEVRAAGPSSSIASACDSDAACDSSDEQRALEVPEGEKNPAR